MSTLATPDSSPVDCINGYDTYLTKTDPDGNTLWIKPFDEAIAKGVRIVDDVIYIQGETQNNVSQKWMLKVDTDDNQIGSTYVVDSTLRLYDFIVDSNGNSYHLGKGGTGNSSYLNINKYDSNYNLQWTKQIDLNYFAGRLELNSDETELIFAGNSLSSTFEGVTNPNYHPIENQYRYSVVVGSVSTNNGTLNWGKWLPYYGIERFWNTYAPHVDPSVDEVDLDGSDNIYITHSGDWSEHGELYSCSRKFIQITKLDASGNELWSRKTGGSEGGSFGVAGDYVPVEMPQGMVVSKGGQIYVVATTDGLRTGPDRRTWYETFHDIEVPDSTNLFLFKANGSSNDNVAGFDNDEGFDCFQVRAEGPTAYYYYSGVLREAFIDLHFNFLMCHYSVVPTRLLDIVETSQCVAPWAEAAAITPEQTLSRWWGSDPNSYTNEKLVGIKAVQDNVTDGDKKVLLVARAESDSDEWDQLYWEIPFTVVDKPIPTTGTFAQRTEPYVTLGFDNATVIEGDSGTQTRTLRVTMDRIHTSNVTVNLTDNGTCTAANGVDFTYPASITIPAGQSEGTDNVVINGDTTEEYDEIACIDVVSVTNADADGFQQARLKIVDDEVPPAPTSLSGTAPSNTQQVNLTWTASTSALTFNHVIYWKKDVTSSITIDPDDNSTYDGKKTLGSGTTNYTHNGLDAASLYHYVIRAEADDGRVSLAEPTPPASAHSVLTSSFPAGGSVASDPDPDLLVYYEFNGDLTDSKQYHGDNRYDLTAVGGATVVYSQSRFSGNTAVYFDASNGYAYNNNLNDDNESNLFANDNFTVSFWYYADDDMPDFSSVMSSREVPETGNDGGNYSWQLDSDNSRLRWRSQQGAGTGTRVHTVASGSYPTHQWSHATFVKYDNGTSMIYMNGVLRATSSEPQPTPMTMLKIGTNRRNELPWKGYIDEFKIYKRALTGAEVTNLYNNGTP